MSRQINSSSMKAAFTIITPNYIAHAKALGDSIVKHNPEYRFFICLIGHKSELKVSIDLQKFDLIEFSQLQSSRAMEEMQQRYTPFELSCALKPYFADHLLESYQINRLKYFDSDIMIFNTFDQMLENDTSSIFLTPHYFVPVAPSETDITNDSTLIKSGVFNAGFFEVTNAPVARDFLKWWKARLENYSYAYKDPFEHIFVDQSWLNLVPVFFKDVRIIEHAGYNAAFFNLQERNLSVQANRHLVNETTPLIFFHFTGYKYYNNDEGSINNKKYTPRNNAGLKMICDEYHDVLITNQVELASPPPKHSGSRHIGNMFFNGLNKITTLIFKVKLVRTTGS